MMRITPLEPPYESEVQEQLEQMMPPGVPPIALFRTFVRNLPMTRAMHPWGRYELGRELSLSMREREIVIDRTCARCRCEYEWGVHLAFFAERVGFDADQMRSLTGGAANDECWTEENERLLIEAVDSLHDLSELPDDLWSRLAGVFTDAQILDLVLLCGWYHAISYAANAVRLAGEPGAPRFADVT